MKKFFSLLFIVMSIAANGQENSELKEAQDLFTSGNYEEAAKLIEDKLAEKKTVYSKSEKEAAYTLLIQIYTEQKNLKSANNVVKKLYKNNPVFKPISGVYQEDFYSILKTIKVRPKFILGEGLGVGGKIILKQIINKPSIENVNTNISQGANSYKVVTLFPAFSFFFEWQFFTNLSGNLCLSYSPIKLRQSIVYDVNYYARTSYSYTEEAQNLNYELSLKKYFFKSSFNPYFSFGAYLSQLVSSNATLNQEGDAQLVAKGDMSNSRNKFREGITGKLGIGFMSKKKRMLHLEFKYMHDFTSFSNSNKFNNALSTYGYIDNDFYLDQIQVSLVLSIISRRYYLSTLK